MCAFFYLSALIQNDPHLRVIQIHAVSLLIVVLEFFLHRLAVVSDKFAPNLGEKRDQEVVNQFDGEVYPVINRQVRPSSNTRLYRLNRASSHSSSPAIH